MKILIVTKELYPKNPTGLGISTHTHAQILKKNGHDVKIVSNNHELSVDYHIYCSNIFRFFSNYLSFKNKALEIVNNFKPDIIIIESLQTIISEFFLSIKYNRKIKIVLISHGISIFPYKINFKYCLRFLIYLTYLPFLYFLLKKVDIFYSLNWTNKSNRHLDEKFYMKSKKNYNIIKYFNTSRYENLKVNNNFSSKKIISCFGYIGEVKNQKEFLKIAKKFCKEDVIFRIIYQSFDNNYLKECEKFCEHNKLNKVQFINGNDADIKDKIEESHIIVNTSITEVFPLTLVEGISMGVPFVSYDKGNISWVKGGLVAKDYFELEGFVKLLINNSFFYDKLSNQAKIFYTKNLSNTLLEKKMKEFYFE